MTIGYSDMDKLVNAEDKVLVLALKDEYFDLQGLAACSKLGKSTIRDYIKSRGLPFYKLGGKIMFKRSEFDAWMKKFKGKSNLDEVVRSVMDRVNNG